MNIVYSITTTILYSYRCSVHVEIVQDFKEELVKRC